MGTTTTVVVDEPHALAAAFEAARLEIDRIDRTCSRFREDSELSLLNRAAGGAAVATSPLLEEALVVALEVARRTGGLVDPTVGPCLLALGYTVTFSDLELDGPDIEMRVERAAGWEAVAVDGETHTTRLPAGVGIDLGATGKAWAADRAAAAAAESAGVGVAVDCGGDVAVAGPPPPGGWPVRVAARRDADAEWQDVCIFDGGLATSGTGERSWRRGGRLLHHIVDPRTGEPASTEWRVVTVAAATCVEANAAATAAIVLGTGAPGWLGGLGLAARLVDRSGRVQCTAAWPGAPW